MIAKARKISIELYLLILNTSLTDYTIIDANEG